MSRVASARQTVVRAAGVLPALALLALAGCGPGRGQFAPACPVPQLVSTLADITRFNGAGRDLTDLVVQARVVGVSGACQPGSDDSTLAASVSITIAVHRGPGMAGREVNLPVFVAVSRDAEVLDKQLLPVQVVFPQNVDRLRMTSKPIDLTLPVGAGVNGASYHII